MRLPLRISARRIHLILVLACALARSARGQQLIGYVNTRDADVTGASDTLNGQAVLTGSASVTAHDHTAPVTLGRGGTLRVCQTSAVHITESRSADEAAPLLFSLDRGAMEIQTAGTLNDTIMTPDLRFTVVAAGQMDLRLRVARNGDTCVENRGQRAPTLDISDPFGEALYQIAAGQHVLFEHGNLHQVVDHEDSPCGCPEQPKGMSVADALLASGGGASPAVKPPVPVPAVAAIVPTPAPVPASAPLAAAPPLDPQTQLRTAERAAATAAMRAAEEKHPFPEAISEGLAPAAEVPQAAPGTGHVLITDSLSYNAPTPVPTASAALGRKPRTRKQTAAAPAPGQAATPAPQPRVNDLVHVVGRFFKRLFGG